MFDPHCIPNLRLSELALVLLGVLLWASAVGCGDKPAAQDIVEDAEMTVDASSDAIDQMVDAPDDTSVDTETTDGPDGADIPSPCTHSGFQPVETTHLLQGVPDAYFFTMQQRAVVVDQSLGLVMSESDGTPLAPHVHTFAGDLGNVGFSMSTAFGCDVGRCDQLFKPVSGTATVQTFEIEQGGRVAIRLDDVVLLEVDVDDPRALIPNGETWCLDDHLVELDLNLRYDFAPNWGGPQLDRAAVPGLSRLVVGMAEDYNQGSPAQDVAGDFTFDLVARLGDRHASWDDELVAQGLSPCSVLGDGSGSCMQQLGPLAIPDVLTVDVSQPMGFPNGRRLEDPAFDIVLGTVLIDFGVMGQTETTLVGTNPLANDVPFGTEFPYVAESHP